MNLRFEPVPRQDFEDFKKDVKDIFAIAVIKHFGMPEDGEVVPDADVDESLYNPKAEVFYVYLDDKTGRAIATRWICSIFILIATVKA